MIYFLLKNDDLVYIGKTTRLTDRLYEHRDKDYSQYAAISTNNDDLIEHALINTYKPALNKRTLSVIKTMQAFNDQALYNIRTFKDNGASTCL